MPQRYAKKRDILRFLYKFADLVSPSTIIPESGRPGGGSIADRMDGTGTLSIDLTETSTRMAYEKKEIYDEGVSEGIALRVREILALLGEDPDREGLLKTPMRVAKSLQFLTQGYSQDGAELIKAALFDEKYRQMVLVKDIELYSMCEHHMLPFIGKCHVAYIPDGKITGLSKIARVVETYARRLQVQERLTVQIRDCIQQALRPLGVAVVIEAMHTCMCVRGVQKSNAITTTSAFSGAFLSSARTRNEFLNLIK